VWNIHEEIANIRPIESHKLLNFFLVKLGIWDIRFVTYTKTYKIYSNKYRIRKLRKS